MAGKKTTAVRKSRPAGVAWQCSNGHSLKSGTPNLRWEQDADTDKWVAHCRACESRDECAKCGRLVAPEQKAMLRMVLGIE